MSYSGPSPDPAPPETDPNPQAGLPSIAAPSHFICDDSLTFPRVSSQPCCPPRAPLLPAMTCQSHGYLWAWSPERQAPWHQVQAPDWLQASGEGNRRQGSGGKVSASRRPRATPPKPPEMYRRLPTAATAWATDSSIGDPTEAEPEERWGGQRGRTGDIGRRPIQRSQSGRSLRGDKDRRTDTGRQGGDRYRQMNLRIRQQKTGREQQTENKRTESGK